MATTSEYSLLSRTAWRSITSEGSGALECKKQIASRRNLWYAQSTLSYWHSYAYISELTAEKVDAETPLAQVNWPPETPQFPFDVDMVKLDDDPLKV